MIQEALRAELGYLEQAIQWADSCLKNAPEGSLLVDTHRKEPRYYWRETQHVHKGTYLSKEHIAKAQSLAQKDYALQIKKVAATEMFRLEKLFARNKKAGERSCEEMLAGVYEQLPPERKQLVVPYEISDEDYAQQWLQTEYEANGHSFGVTAFYTQQGQRVRSKSEVIIADHLNAAGVPYKYEKSLFIGGYSPVYPDFTVLNKRTRKEYVWEHLGAMDNPEYCNDALDKLNRYARSGYLPGEKLLITQESASVPLDTRVVSALIEQFLL